MFSNSNPRLTPPATQHADAPATPPQLSPANPTAATREAQQRATAQANSISRRVLTTGASARQAVSSARGGEAPANTSRSGGRRDAASGDRLLSATTRSMQIAATQIDEAGNAQTAFYTVDDSVTESSDVGRIAPDSPIAGDGIDDDLAASLDTTGDDGVGEAQRRLARREVRPHDPKRDAKAEAARQKANGAGNASANSTTASGTSSARTGGGAGGSVQGLKGQASRAAVNPWDSAAYDVDGDGSSQSGGGGGSGGGSGGSGKGGVTAAGAGGTGTADLRGPGGGVGGIGATKAIKPAARVHAARLPNQVARGRAARMMTGGVVLAAGVIIVLLLVHWIAPSSDNGAGDDPQRRQQQSSSHSS